MSTITRTLLISLFGLLLLCNAAVAQSQPQLIVTVESGTPTPDPITTGQTTSTTFNIALDAPQNIHQELQQDGADQSYTIQLTNASGTSDGNPESVTISGSTLKDDGRIGDFDIDFDRANSCVTISSHQDTGLLSSVGVVASFTSYGLKHINLDGSATIDGNTYNDDDGGRAEVTLIDFHVRADTNVDTNINENDDPTADSPGLFVALNTDDDNGNSTPDRTETTQVAGENDMKPCRMALDPLPPASGSGYDYQRYVRLSRSNTNARVWRSTDKAGANGHGGAILVNDLSNTWDLTDTDYRDRFLFDRNNLSIEGYDPGSTTLTLELIDNSNQVVLSDTLVVNAWGVELQVNNTEAVDDDIVCRRSTSPAGRPELACRARLVGGAPAMTIYVDNGGASGTGQLRFGTTAGSVTAQNLTLSLAAGSGNSPGAWSNFRISGETESQSMRDAVIRTKEDDSSGDVVGQVPTTVLWVTLSRKDQATDTVSNDNSARQAYHNWASPNTYALGPRRYSDDRIGWGMEYKGDVHPSDFTEEVKLERDMHIRYYRDTTNGTTLYAPNPAWTSNFGTPPPANDTGPDWARDDTPPEIYDFDAAGIPSNAAPQGTIWRFRSNWRELASFDYGGGTVVRCSDNLEYYIRMSYRQVSAGTTDDWQPLNNVTNDNQTGNGTTNVTWDLQ